MAMSSPSSGTEEKKNDSSAPGGIDGTGGGGSPNGGGLGFQHATSCSPSPLSSERDPNPKTQVRDRDVNGAVVASEGEEECVSQKENGAGEDEKVVAVAEAPSAGVPCDEGRADNDNGRDTSEKATATTEGRNDDNGSSTPIQQKWSSLLSTPKTSPLFSPSVEMSPPKSNLHGLGLRGGVDRARFLGRAAKGCSNILNDVAALHDDLGNALNKICPSLLEGASEGTPMEGFAAEVNSCVSSFAVQNKNLGLFLKNHVSAPYRENGLSVAEGGKQGYRNYVASRSKCAQARRDALKLRKKYVDLHKELDAALAALRKARATRSTRKRMATDSSNDTTSSREEGMEVSSLGEVTNASPSLEEELRQCGERTNLVKQCEAVIKASEEVKNAEAKYRVGVAEENSAVDEACDAECAALDSMQRVEEERILFLIGLLDRFLQDSKESLQNMSLILVSVEPLNLDDSNRKGVVPPLQSSSSTSSTMATTTAQTLFMSPRRRAQSDDGPAINETRMLGLPDGIAEARDCARTLMGRQLARLKTLKSVVSFNDGVASAIESFASGLRDQLGGNVRSCLAALQKEEGSGVLNAWNSVTASLEMLATCAEILARQIGEGNGELREMQQASEKEGKAQQEQEETRWKAVCDAARIETKAKVKHKQSLVDLEKARTRLQVMESEGGAGASSLSEGGVGATVGEGDGIGGISPLKPRTPSTKMDRHVNKAMGKMFSILPGGGEDVMSKVLTPTQRQGIVQRQLDEAVAREGKGCESFEVARSVKAQAVLDYAEAARTKFKEFREEERRVWDSMQGSLVCCVAAMRVFRDGHMRSMESSIESMAMEKMCERVPEEALSWAVLVQKRISDQRSCSAEDPGQSSECGFSLLVQLGQSVDSIVRRYLDEKEELSLEDSEDAANNGGNDVATEPTQKEEREGDDNERELAPPPQSVPSLPDVPPDPFIKKMDVIFAKRILKNVTIERYYTAGWSEVVPLYGPWLKRKGSFEVFVGDWEHASSLQNGNSNNVADEGGFENAWSKEKFPLKRVVRFKFKRTTHLYIGPPIAGVTQTQYMVKESNERCIVMMTVEMDGIPYSDAFAVEVRWSARRVGGNDVAVDAGVFVRFIKTSMFASKIKSGTLKETAPIHLDLFEVIKSAIASVDKGKGIDGIEAKHEEKKEEEMDDANEIDKSTKSVEMEDIEMPATNRVSLLNKGMIDQAVAVSTSLSRNQCLMVAFAILFLVTRPFFGMKEDPRMEAIGVLSRKVDSLTDEIDEMKAMIVKILEIVEQKGFDSDNYGGREATCPLEGC